MNTKLKLLLLATALLVTRAQAAVRVYGEASSTGPEISVTVYADIADTAIVSHTFKLFYNPADLQLIQASHNLDVWFLHDGSATVPYAGPDGSQPGEILFAGAHMDGRNPRSGVTGNRVLLGSARFLRSNPNTPSFDMTLGQGGHFANFVDTSAQTLEVVPGEVRILSVKANPADEDLDGLGDRWEDRFFGGTRGVFYSDDKDGDGVNNLGEQAMGSDPTDSKSLLRLSITEGRGRVVIEWPSADERIYAIEGAKRLSDFGLLKDGIKATPPMNTIEFDRSELPDTFFFRVSVQAPPLQ
jgi:hypothetical protein